MPGHHADAVRVINGEFEVLKARCISDGVPRGCTRKVYRVGDVVYKVEGAHEFDNITEAQIFYEFRKESWASPVTLYKVGEEKVLCMPFYDNHEDASLTVLEDEERISSVLEDWMIAHGKNPDLVVADIDYGNHCILADGTFKVIDAAGNFNM